MCPSHLLGIAHFDSTRKNFFLFYCCYCVFPFFASNCFFCNYKNLFWHGFSTVESQNTSWPHKEDRKFILFNVSLSFLVNAFCQSIDLLVSWCEWDYPHTRSRGSCIKRMTFPEHEKVFLDEVFSIKKALFWLPGFIFHFISFHSSLLSFCVDFVPFHENTQEKLINWLIKFKEFGQFPVIFYQRLLARFGCSLDFLRKQ